MLDQAEILKIFHETGVWQEGHFLLTSGQHSGNYLQCAKVLQYPQYTEVLCREIARRFAEDKIDLVAAPAIGGILIAYEVARHLKTKMLFTERVGKEMTLRRGFTLEPGAKVLVVEDVITTGGSVQEVIDLLQKQGGNISGVATFVDRSGGKVKFLPRTEALLSLEVTSYSPEECPLCQAGLAVEKPGSRKLAKKG
jgi:orotate phosphoribosyltransferase